MSALAVALLAWGATLGLWVLAARRLQQGVAMGKRDVPEPPHEPGIGRRLRALDRDGILVGWSDAGWWWWESPFGTPFDPPPPGCDGPFPSALSAIEHAEAFREANPA